MSNRKAYIRSMDGWWLKNPFYIKYMIREATSVFVGIYVLVLLVGLMGLASGEAAYNDWLAVMTNPLAVVFHFIAFIAAIYHTITWFAVAPKIAPLIVIGKQKIPDLVITAIHYCIAIVLYFLLFWMVVNI